MELPSRSHFLKRLRIAFRRLPIEALGSEDRNQVTILGNTRVVALGVRDKAEMVDVWEAAVGATHTFMTARHIKQYQAYLPATLQQATWLAGIRTPHGSLLGFAGGYARHLTLLFVQPNWQRRGIGTRLLAHAVQRRGVRLLAVHEANTHALTFYLKHGFVVQRRSELDSLGESFPVLHLHKH